MKYSYNWLKELVPKLPKPEKLGELLNLHAFEVEEIRPYGKDHMFDIGVLPNRIADASGHTGMAREIAAILDVALSLPRGKYEESKKIKTRDVLTVSVKENNRCGRYKGRAVFGVEVKESPAWLKERLEVCGLRSINAVVDATNYIMLETGQPLHAFDYDKLSPRGADKKTIVVRNATAGERITTLDGVDVALQEHMLVIADEEFPLAIAGIKGGAKAEITSNTTRIVLEAANFDGPSTRKTSHELGIRTDSAVRFSAGMSATLAEEAMERVCTVIQDIVGGEVLAGSIDIYPKKEKPISITLRVEYVRGLLGAPIKEKEIKVLLERLECKVTGLGKPTFRVTPPIVRRDLRMEEDLIEEIGRLWGYTAIEPQHPLSELVPPEENDTYIMQERMRDMFAASGFQEVYNYSFVGDDDIHTMGDTQNEYIALENPTRPEYAYLRASLGAGLLRNVALNLKHSEKTHLFEMGHVFRQSNGSFSERMHAAGVFARKRSSKESVLFFELKGALSLFFERLGVDAWFDEMPSPGGIVLHPHRAALVKIGEEKIGVMGEAHPRVREHYGIKGEVALFELDADVLSRLTLYEKEFRPVSRYPSVMRDISLLVPPDTRTVEVLDVIENTGGGLLIDTDLIDMYAGPELPDEKKNFLFRLIFQAPDHTLTSEEVDTIMNSITAALEEASLEWEIR